MQTSVQVHAEAAQAGLAAVQRQLPFAMSRACNLTVGAAVKSVKLNVQARFVLRQPKYILSSIMVLRLADKTRGNIVGRDRRRAEINVADLRPGEIGAAAGLHPNPLGGRTRREPILERFETGRAKTRNVAIPTTTLRPSFSDQVPRQFYPKNLGLAARRAISGGMEWSGTKYGAFIMGNPGEKRYGIWARMPQSGAWGDAYVAGGKNKGARRKQRKGATPVPTRLVKLWHLKDTVQIPARLEFFARAMPYVRGFKDLLITELRKALRDTKSTGLTPSNRWSDEEEVIV